MAEFRFETERLVLRDWREEDCDDLHALCRDPAVMATIGPVMDREEARAFLARLDARARDAGHTVWALERKSDGRVIGFTGIVRSIVPAIAGELEIGWRLASDCWRQGLAREAAEASLGWAAEHRPGERVVAITAVINTRSRALMERLGTMREPHRDFDHPAIEDSDPLRPHVVYSIDPGRGGAAEASQTLPRG